MHFKIRHSLIGGSVAFLLATSCCWLPALLVVLGGATGLMSMSEQLENYSGAFMGLGVVFLGVGVYQYYQSSFMKNTKVILSSTLTCPRCEHQKIEIMPTDACQYFYECENCKTVLKPLAGDCCVYCSYGTVACPPIQLGEECC